MANDIPTSQQFTEMLKANARAAGALVESTPPPPSTLAPVPVPVPSPGAGASPTGGGK